MKWIVWLISKMATLQMNSAIKATENILAKAPICCDGEPAEYVGEVYGFGVMSRYFFQCKVCGRVHFVVVSIW